MLIEGSQRVEFLAGMLAKQAQLLAADGLPGEAKKLAERAINLATSKSTFVHKNF